MRALLLALALAGCKREQTFDEAMRVLCELPKSIDAGDVTELVRIARERVTNPEVVAWMRTISESPEQRDAKVLLMLNRAKIDRCFPQSPITLTIMRLRRMPSNSA